MKFLTLRALSLIGLMALGLSTATMRPAWSAAAAKPDGLTTRDALDRDTLCAIDRGKNCSPLDAIAKGLFETGTTPLFPENAKCHGIDDGYAMDYTFKRSGEAYHGGIDMPAPFGTPIIAAAAGTVVAKYRGQKTPRGMEVIIRHAPEDTGIPLWIYTQYAHFDEMPKVEVGQRVRMGEVLGPTGNSGVSGRTKKQSNKRRPAIHFAIWYSTSELYVDASDVIFPVNGYWMDPVAFYRQALPLDTQSIKNLTAAEKTVPIPVLFEDGSSSPAGTKVVWPYACKRN